MIELFHDFNFKTMSYVILKSGTKKYTEKHKLAFLEGKDDVYYSNLLWKHNEAEHWDFLNMQLWQVDYSP